MGAVMDSFRVYRFDEFTIDGPTMRLLRDGRDVTLEPKSLRLLLFLIENRNRLLTKDEILREVWSETAVTDNALTRAVAQVRKALDDDPRHPRYIETAPTLGYRFIGEVALGESPKAKAVPPVARPLTWIWAVAATLALAAIGLSAWRLRSRPPAAELPAPVPLTSYQGSQDFPSFSPDGDEVAFEWDGEKRDNFDIYVKTLDSDATPLRLTTNPAPDRWPAWSPDGRSIAFLRIVDPGKADVMVVPALGGPERKLAELPIWNGICGEGLAWSANNKWLVVSALSGQQSVLFRVSVDSGEAIPLTHPGEALQDSFPKISPDGSTLLFNRHLIYEMGDLYSVALDADAVPSGTPHRIPAGDARFADAAWTADGRDILAEVVAGVSRLPVSGTDNPSLIPWLGPEVYALELSRSGNRLVYSVVHGDANIWELDLTAKTAHPQELVASTFRDVYPQFSPDGKQLAFYSERTGTGEVWLADASGGHERQLTFAKFGTKTSTPRWSPDGRMLTVDSDITGAAQIYEISAGGGEMKQLTHGSAANFGTIWSRDGRWIYFTSQRTGRDEIWKMPAQGGTAVQITQNGGMYGVESEDGKTLYFCRRSGSGSIWEMPAAGGTAKQLTASLYRTNFAVTRRGIYYMANPGEDGTTAIFFFSFASRTSAMVLRIGRPEYGLDVSPDGRYLSYAQLDDPYSNLMLVDHFH